MPILKHICPSNMLCNSSECEHKREHEKNEFCSEGCKWSKNSLCQSDLKGYIDSVLCDVIFAAEQSIKHPDRESTVTPTEALDLIMAAIIEEYGE